MTINRLRRRFNIPIEWPRSLIEPEPAHLHRLIATGVRYGVGAWCATNKHDTCTDTPEGCRCYCHAPTKRFTDAELAAQVWWYVVQFHLEPHGPERQELARQNGIVERFATLPHHDQENP